MVVAGGGRRLLRYDSVASQAGMCVADKLALSVKRGGWRGEALHASRVARWRRYAGVALVRGIALPSGVAFTAYALARCCLRLAALHLLRLRRCYIVALANALDISLLLLGVWRLRSVVGCVGVGVGCVARWAGGGEAASGGGGRARCGGGVFWQDWRLLRLCGGGRGAFVCGGGFCWHCRWRWR